MENRKELLGFIKWKLRFEPKFWEEVRLELESMSILELTRWAIRHDIIDA